MKLKMIWNILTNRPVIANVALYHGQQLSVDSNAIVHRVTVNVFTGPGMVCHGLTDLSEVTVNVKHGTGVQVLS